MDRYRPVADERRLGGSQELSGSLAPVFENSTGRQGTRSKPSPRPSGPDPGPSARDLGRVKNPDREAPTGPDSSGSSPKTLTPGKPPTTKLKTRVDLPASPEDRPGVDFERMVSEI